MLLKKLDRGLVLFDKNPVTGLLIVAIITHVISVFLLGFEVVEYGDSEGYLELAKRLQTMNFHNYQFERTPGYSLLIQLLGMNLNFLVLVQYVIGFLATVLFFKIVKALFKKPRVSILIALIPSFITNYYYYERAVLTETLSLFLFVWVVYLFCVRKDSIRNLLYTGIVCAFLMMTRTLFLYLAPLAALIYLYENRKESNLFLLKRFVVLVGPTVFCFVLWSGMNKAATGNFALTSFFGINLAQTSVSFFDKYEGERSEIKEIYVKHILETDLDVTKTKKHAIWAAYEELLVETGYDLPELSNVLGDMSKELIINNFDQYLVQVVISFKDFWKNDLYWLEDGKNSFVGKTFVLWRRASRAVQLLINVLFIVSFVYYSYRFLFYKESKNRLVVFVLLAVMAGSILQALVVYGDNARFSFPFYSMITLLSVYFINHIFQIMKIKIK